MSQGNRTTRAAIVLAGLVLAGTAQAQVPVIPAIPGPANIHTLHTSTTYNCAGRTLAANEECIAPQSGDRHPVSERHNHCEHGKGWQSANGGVPRIVDLTRREEEWRSRIVNDCTPPGNCTSCTRDMERWRVDRYWHLCDETPASGTTMGTRTWERNEADPPLGGTWGEWRVIPNSQERYQEEVYAACPPPPRDGCFTVDNPVTECGPDEASGRG